jgi:hypothetical protein
MTVAESIAKWRKGELKERSAAQTHFIHPGRGASGPMPSWSPTRFPANRITYRVEVTDDVLAGVWQTGPSLIGQVGTAADNGDGTETVTVRHLVPMEQADRKFMRMKLIWHYSLFLRSYSARAPCA